METKRLIMYFADADGKKHSVSIDDPKFDISPSEVQDAMNTIITNEVLVNSFNQPFTLALSARIVTTHIEEITE